MENVNINDIYKRILELKKEIINLSQLKGTVSNMQFNFSQVLLNILTLRNTVDNLNNTLIEIENKLDSSVFKQGEKHINPQNITNCKKVIPLSSDFMQINDLNEKIELLKNRVFNMEEVIYSKE